MSPEAVTLIINRPEMYLSETASTVAYFKNSVGRELVNIMACTNAVADFHIIFTVLV